MSSDAEAAHTSGVAMSDKTATMARSLEDSLAHWCTTEPRDIFHADLITEHQ